MQLHKCLRSEWLISVTWEYRQHRHLRCRPAAGFPHPVSTANDLPPHCDTFQIVRARQRNASLVADHKVKSRRDRKLAPLRSHPALLHKFHPTFSFPGAAERVHTALVVVALLRIESLQRVRAL